ncbi:MAG: tetratricopeptide repeat protein [Bdellovibrionia bacterium]
MSKSPDHPLIYRYLKKYQEDPRSRVFAPLAEAYRKAGLVDEAIEIAREGLQIHPHFTGGRVALARALFDQKQYQQVIDELSSLILDHPDNLVAQKLVAESQLILGNLPAALEAYKMLLYFVPQDEETAKLVQEIESQAYERGVLTLRSDPPEPEVLPDFSVKSAPSAFGEDPEALKAGRISKIQTLQGVLQKLERYRVRAEIQGVNPLSPRLV